MANYKKMYHELFHSVSDTIDRLSEALLSAEEIYISEEERLLSISEIPKDEDDMKE